MKSFLSFRLDDADGTLWRGHEMVWLTRKAGALLRCLVDRAGSPVEKGDIISAVWPDTHVHPDNVKVLVREIRLALGDDPQSPTFIRSDAGHGYTFIAPVADTLNANFIGRSRELGTLVDALDGVRAGAPRVLLLTGERGVGKSSLCDMFLRMTSAATALRSCTGECRQDGDEPLGPVLRALAHLERKAPALVRDVLAIYAPSWLKGLIPGTTLQGSEPGDAVNRLSTVLARLSESVPLVMVLEDLQWADPVTVDALVRLSQQRGAAKWMVLGTCAPHSGSDAGRGSLAALSGPTAPRRIKTVELGRLTELYVRRYLDERLGVGRLSGATAAITAITGGNPGMLVKVVDDFISRGFVTAGADGWQLALTPRAIEGVLPELLIETFQGEVDALDARTRTALEIASLAGETFTCAAVAGAWEMNTAGVERLLVPLARRGHIIRARRGPSPAYAFRHPAYADLLARRAPFAQQLRAARAFIPHEERQRLRA